MKTKLYRFSLDGFVPKFQSFHVDCLEKGLVDFKNNFENYPLHLRPYIYESYKEVLKNWRDFDTGVFSFLSDLPDRKIIKLLLNHLTEEQKNLYSWWSAEISINEYCFEVGNGKLWKEKGFFTIEDMINKKAYEVFIPKQYLQIQNIEKLNFKF